MKNLDPYQVTAKEIAQRVNAGDWDPLELVHLYVKRTDNLCRELNTHINWDQEEVLRSAEQQLDYIVAARKAGKPLPLAGVPIAVKDNILVKGTLTTCASRILANFKSPYDATVIERLRESGAFILGKTNLDEFAMGSSNENSAFGPVLNPWNTKRVPGGSSGGSAATVAAGMAPLALGSDTGGSIRQPASFCGVVGLKPTYGRISRYGLVAYASSLDQIGPLGRATEDVALLYQVMAGHDPRDSTSLQDTVSFWKPPSLTKGRAKDLKGLRIGVIQEFLQDPAMDDDVRQVIQKSLEDLRSLGAQIKSVKFPSALFGIAAYYVTATAEASSNLSRYDGIRYGFRSQSFGNSLRDLYLSTRSEGFGKEVKQRIMLGTFALSSGYYEAYYQKAKQARRLMKDEIEKIFGEVDLIACPTTPGVAFELGSKTRDPLSMYLSDVYTIHANLGGYPAISVPCGFTGEQMPVGLQLMAPLLREDQLFQCSFVYEKAKRWNDDFKPRC